MHLDIRQFVLIIGLQIPQSPPGLTPDMSPATARITLQRMFPPRGGIRMLDREVVEQGRPAVERFVAEEYILDALESLNGHRSDSQTVYVS